MHESKSPITIDLATPLNITSGCNIKNRLFKSAMSEQLASASHDPSQELINLYSIWANGGTGLLVTGNVMVSRDALGEPKNVVLDKDSDLALFKQWAKQGQEQQAQLWMQLNHPGKQTPNFLTEEPVAPSAIPLGKQLQSSFNTPRALSEDEILAIVEQFAYAASKAKQCGFSGVQIHGAHGYLVSQFLSPHHNRREDKWGGSLDNRVRFVREVYKAIRREVGEQFPIGIKLNSADFQKGGFSEDDSMQVIQLLQQDGINLIEISGGNYESPSMMGSKAKQSTITREAYFLDFAEKAKKQLSVPLVVTGGFRSSKAMQAALQSGATDMIGLARPLAVYPDVSHSLIADADFVIKLKPLTTGWSTLDFIAMLSITWYEHQLAFLGNGKKAKPNFSTWISVIKTFKDIGVHSFKRRRA